MKTLFVELSDKEAQSLAGGAVYWDFAHANDSIASAWAISLGNRTDGYAQATAFPGVSYSKSFSSSSS